MKRSAILFLLPFALASCAEVEGSGTRLMDNVEENGSTTWNKMREYTGTQHKQQKPPEPNTQARYCYRSIQDIICYGHPLHGQEDRLIAYQGNHGQTGYVLSNSDNRSTAPVSLPPLKSVTVKPPPPVKGVDNSTDPNKKQLKEIIFDPAELMPKELVPPKTE